MLQLSGSLANQAVMSLRTGGQVALATEPIINPNNLKIEGLYCDDRFEKKQLILLVQDIRERIDQGFIVNDHEVLAEPEELIRLKDVLKLNFTLIGKPVVTTKRRRIGKVNDFAFDDNTMFIQKLYVGQSIVKSLNGGSLSVERTQIVEITDKKIIIKEPLRGVPDVANASAIA